MAEKQRLAHIKRNQEMLVRLGILDAKEELAGPSEKKAPTPSLLHRCLIRFNAAAEGTPQASQLSRRAR
jgi:hypothetical protein